jgi:hypothetical protein
MGIAYEVLETVGCEMHVLDENEQPNSAIL